MKIETLQERITKAEAKIERKQNTIVKKTAQIQKKSDMLMNKFGYDASTGEHHAPESKYNEQERHDIYWTMCDIGSLKEDIRRGTREIEETKNTLEKYRKQLAGEIERESRFIREVPESMKRMQEELSANWDRWDIAKRDSIRKAYKELGWEDFYKAGYRYSDKEFMYTTDEQIHEANMRDAKIYVINMYNKVKEITGEVTDWSGIRLEIGGGGFPTLTGSVTGKEGRAYVETILAGGYNIQRLHVRTLVHDHS